MPSEDRVLLLFALLPVFFGLLLYWFFGKRRLHRRASRGPAGTGKWAARGLLLGGNLLEIAFLASVLVLAGECYFRFGRDTTDSFGLTKTTQRWFRRHYRMNNVGFRDNLNYHLAIAPGKRRVTFVGDSFTAGHGIRDVEDRFANQLRKMRPGWEVHVMARNGWDTEPELLLLSGSLPRASGGGYQMDRVVLVYCLNDVSDLIPEWQQRLGQIYEQWAPPYLARESYLFNTLYFRLTAARDPSISNYYQITLHGYEGEVWAAQQARLRQIAEVVRRQGGQLAVVTFPFLHALGPDYPYRGVHQQLDAFWRENGVPHLDLLDTFERSSPAQVTVNPYDAHPNERAHQMAARAIAAFLDPQMAGPREAAKAAP